MKKSFNIKFNLYILLFLLIAPPVQSQVQIVADRSDATYKAGEPMNFNITSASSGTATYTIRYDQRSPVITTGEIELSAGQLFQLPFKIFEPSFVLCSVNINGSSDMAAAAFSPYDIAPYEPEPVDFDEFWNQQKQLLANVPMNANVQFLSESTYSTTYKVSLSNIDNRRVHGYLSVPKGGGTYPATLIMPPFGSGPNHVTPKNYVTEQGAIITFALSIHNNDPAVGDNNAYQPNDISTREGNYYRYALLGAVRAIDYIFQRPEFDGNNMAVMGVSQGGGLSLSVAGLDNRIKLMINSISALCQHSGLKYGKTGGHPYFIFQSRTTDGSPEHEAATVNSTKYYDAMNFAKRFKGPSLSYISYEDITCPPGTVFAANNQLKNTKVIFHRREEGHDGPDYWVGRFDFIRKHFGTMPLVPFATTGTGYHADAGEDQYNIAVNQTISLTGAVEIDGAVNNNLPVLWEKVEGPGRVKIASPNNRTTNISFSEAGTYLIRFSAVDDNFPTEEAKWVTVIDFVKVVVE